jgi:hypothetical protein
VGGKQSLNFISVITILRIGVTFMPDAVVFVYSEVKSSLVATILLILQMRGFLSVPFAIVYFGVVLFLVYFDIAAQVIGTHDPFVPLENIICAVFFGGLVDSLRKATSGGGTFRSSLGDDDKKNS